MKRTSTTTHQQLALADALRIAQQQHIILRASAGRVILWRAGQPIAKDVRSAIRAHRREVLKMLSMGDIAVCPSPDRHRASWDRFVGHYICGHCSRLDRHLREIAA